jgi:uncharacterized membrane protein YdjX (TVP38/TMEM64 family)
MNKTRWFSILLITLIVGGFFWFELGDYFSIEYFKSQQAIIDAYYAAHPWNTVLIYSAIYMVVAGLSLPGAFYLTVYAGTIFGLFWGTVVVSAASTVAAILTFLIARHLLRETIQERFHDSLKSINAGLESDGPLYLFSLRLMPFSPFFIVNVVMGLTPINTLTYAWISQVGMLAGIVVCVNAGTELAELESLSGLFSPGMIISFLLLGILPLASKKTLKFIQNRRLSRVRLQVAAEAVNGGEHRATSRFDALKD